jgi:hypothetical protein
MPAIMIERIEFDKNLWMSLKNLHEILPFIEKEGILSFFIVEISDNNNRLVL